MANAVTRSLIGPVDPNEFIRAVATKLTNSPEEADAAVREMQKDIDECNIDDASPGSYEARIVGAIAWRKVLEFLR